MNVPPGPPAGSQDQQAERWLAQLRDGNAPQKAEARRNLAAIFASRGMPSEAIDMLVTNAREGFGDAALFQTLSRLYHEVGNEYLAASAAMEAARLRAGGPIPPPPGQSAYNRPPPPAPPPTPPQVPRAGASAAYRRAARDAAQGGHGPSVGAATRAVDAPVSSLLGVQLTRPVRLVCWAVVGAIVIGAAAVSVTSPLAAIFLAVAAAALSLALTGPSSARRSLRLPAGPLGDGGLLLLGILAFLVGGALLPRTPSAPVGPAAGPAPGLATPGTLYAGTPTPSSASSSAAGATVQGGAPSPEPRADATTPGDTTGQRFVVAGDLNGETLRVSPSSTRGGVSAGDGTLVVAVAPDRTVGGRVWRQVRAPDNERGWIEVERLKPAPTGPPPSFPNGRPPSGRACTGGTSIKGYISSSGELIYHRPGSEHYYRTFPVVCFRTEDEARAAGFQPGPGSAQADGAEVTASMPPAASSGPDPPALASSPPPTVQAADVGARVRIVNAGGEGVRLRPSPGAEEVLKVLAEGTTLVSLGEEREDGGRQWRRVREQDGLEGWVAADFLAAVPVTAAVVTVTAVAAVPTLPPAPTATIVVAAVVQPTQAPSATEKPQATAPATSPPKPQAAAPATSVPKPALPTPAPTAQAAPKAAPSGMNCPASHPIKGNHSSSGEWIYHPPSGQFYARTRPEECFATAADASRAGYRPSQR